VSAFELRGKAVVSKRGAARIDNGHLWIYASDVESPPGKQPGIVAVERGGKLVGHAFWSPRSQIAVRMLTFGNEPPPDRELFRRRLTGALERRRRLLPTADACRVVHGEADLLPGIFVDRYGDALALQTTTAAADLFEPDLVQLLDELLAPRALVLRDDVGGRAHEGLRQHVTVVRGEAPIRATYHEGSIAFEVDLVADQKTGSFLDQSTNHVLAGRYAFGRAFDGFTYHGGFALQLAAGADSVLAVDQSAAALARARDNATRNGITKVEWLQADVFALLPALQSQSRRFETIVLDPPAFASGKETVDGALRAYKEINRRAMQLLEPDGILVSCSCSGRVDAASFESMLEAAARDARRRVHVIERRGAGADHPALAGVAETEYLKCRVLSVL
jgi:23S rRNA (cytosine1962-C5)-methyltransferase